MSYDVSAPGSPGTFGMRTVVVSRTLDPARHPGVTVVSGDLASVIGALKTEPGKDIWLFGGGGLFRSLVDLRLVDSVDVAVIPVMLGGGIPLVPAPSPRIRLALSSHRVYERSGIVQLSYSVLNSEG